MGNELACTLRYGGKSFQGKALLESSEIVFRGEPRVKIAFSDITVVEAKDTELHIRTKEDVFLFDLGPQAARWREKIANPKSVLEKLGVKAGQCVSLLGALPADFVANLKKQGTQISENKVTKDSQWIFAGADEKRDLRRIQSLAKSIRGATALWVVYPKGQESISEADVRSAGLKAGLVDVKVVSFSATHTALKFVLRKSAR
jgi:hypothetical protein